MVHFRFSFLASRESSFVKKDAKKEKKCLKKTQYSFITFIETIGSTEIVQKVSLTKMIVYFRSALSNYVNAPDYDSSWFFSPASNEMEN